MEQPGLMLEEVERLGFYLILETSPFLFPRVSLAITRLSNLSLTTHLSTCIPVAWKGAALALMPDFVRGQRVHT